jgi:hypothetical protein
MCSALFVVKKIVNNLMLVKAPSACAKFSKLKFVSFFVRLRIYYILKFINRSTGSRSKQKIAKQFAHV